MTIIHILTILTILGHLYFAWIQISGKKVTIPANLSPAMKRRYQLFKNVHLLTNILIILALLIAYNLHENQLIQYLRVSILLCAAGSSIVFAKAFRFWKIFAFQGLTALLPCLLTLIELKS